MEKLVKIDNDLPLHICHYPKSLLMAGIYNNEFSLLDRKIFDYILSLIDDSLLTEPLSQNIAIKIPLYIDECVNTLWPNSTESDSGGYIQQLKDLIARATAERIFLQFDDITGNYHKWSTRLLYEYEEFGEENGKKVISYNLQVNKMLLQNMLLDNKEMRYPPVEYAVNLTSPHAYDLRAYILGIGIYENPFHITLEEYARAIGATKQWKDMRFQDFRRQYIEKFFAEINNYAIDISIKLVGWTKTGRKTTGMYILVTRTIAEINIADIESSADDRYPVADIEQRLSFTELYDTADDNMRRALKMMVLVIQRAYCSLEDEGATFANKLNMEPEAMREALDHLTKENVEAGINKLPPNWNTRKNPEGLMLQCLLNCGKAISPKARVSKVDLDAAWAEARKMVKYGRFLEHAERYSSFSGLPTGPDFPTKDLIPYMDEVVEAIAFVLTTKAEKIKIGGEKVFTSHILELLRDHAEITNFVHIAHSFKEHESSLKYRNNQNVRRSYILTTITKHIQELNDILLPCEDGEND